MSGIVDIVNKIKQSKYIGQDAEFKNTIAITDTGEVYAAPDLAVINLMVTNEAKTVGEAMAENTKRMNKVIEEMKSLGIEEKDLKTVSYNIYPRYEYEKDRFGNVYGKRILAGYEIRQSLQVKIRNLENIGQVIEKGTAAGANDVGNLQFTIDNQDELKKQAREQAIDKARKKAEQMASQLNVRLGKVTSFSENFYVPYYGAMDYAMEKGIGGAGEVPDIQTGENKITVSVVITYEIY
ncbi:hypothetical protein AMJ47_01945 [Parcubacteria bacterium DG_72]|nr:MAG: hypothetical protein AMJ47_01945 [Parcubacteria bacterium DG_72]